MAGFAPPRGLEAQFRAKLRQVARFIGQIVAQHHDGRGGLLDPTSMLRTLGAYREVLTPWANRLVGQTLARVDTNNLRNWASLSSAIGQELRGPVARTKAGILMRQLQADQVQLITSLPTDAGTRAQAIARKALLEGDRASAIQEAVLALDRTGAVTEARATLIARTEIAKAASALTQSRARQAGVESYIWRTMQDEAVRLSHSDLEGTVHRWDDPPQVGDGSKDRPDEGRHHPGEFPNCRCYPEPIVTGAED